MSQEKTFVLTAYGHGGTVDRISICSFDEPEEAFSSPASQARAYCEALHSQSQGLNGDAWVTARVVSGFRQYPLENFTPPEFDVLLKLDDRDIQKVMRVLDTRDLIMAFKDCDTEIQDTFFRNMSKGAAAMFREEMNYMGSVSFSESQAARTFILDIIRRLEWDGTIIVERLGGDILVEEK